MKILLRLLSTLIAASIGLMAPKALAQIDAERFKPAATPDGWVNAEGSGLRNTADPWEFGLYLNYAKNSLVVVDADGDLVASFVSDRVGIDLLGSVTLFEPLSLGVGMPLYVLQSGDADPSGAGLGDLRLVPKLRLLDDRASFGLALAAEVRLPTNTGDFSGSDSVSVLPKLIADHRYRSGIRVGANVGVALREESTFLNVVAGNEFLYALALGYQIGGLDGNTEVGVELNGAVGLSEADAEEAPLEGLPYVRHRFHPEWSIQGGLGIGLIPGYGVPTVRVFAGVRFAPTNNDRDNDGIPNDQDQCPDLAEDRDRIEDLDGCPEEDPDSDQDGVPDIDDDCPTAKETINGVDDDDGCPDTGDPRVIYEDGEFVILDHVRFEHGSATITEDSHSILDQVALTLKANPQLERVSVEGHTDDSGPEDVNQRLSEQRAASVRRYLINKGVAPQRLQAKGHGESKPLEKGQSDNARSKNRRVEFIVVSESSSK